MSRSEIRPFPYRRLCGPAVSCLDVEKGCPATQTAVLIWQFPGTGSSGDLCGRDITADDPEYGGQRGFGSVLYCLVFSALLFIVRGMGPDGDDDGMSDAYESFLGLDPRSHTPRRLDVAWRVKETDNERRGVRRRTTDSACR